MTEKKIGTKLTDEEAKNVDPAKVSKALGDPDVEGQELYVGLVECPYDGLVFRAIIDTELYRYIQCPNGHIFRA